MSPFGLLNLNKPGGATSREVLNRVQRLLPRRTKIGHAGTLDPLARGVLVAAVGPATRLIDHVQRMPKSYTGTFLLGRSSPTEDVEGQIVELVDPPVPTRDQVAAAAASYVGRIAQRPPDFSALKIGGRRAYDLARRGHRVELDVRPVEVYAMDVVSYDYPELTLDIRCGRGTYVRSLGRDLARRLGTEAVMSALVRTAIGSFTLDEAVDPATVDATSLADHLLPPLRAVANLPRITLTAGEIAEIHHGRTIPCRPMLGASPSASDALDAEWAAVDEDDRLVAILKQRDKSRWGPVLNFLA